jgi:hypothetical protein
MPSKYQSQTTNSLSVRPLWERHSGGFWPRPNGGVYDRRACIMPRKSSKPRAIARVPMRNNREVWGMVRKVIGRGRLRERARLFLGTLARLSSERGFPRRDPTKDLARLSSERGLPHRELAQETTGPRAKTSSAKPSSRPLTRWRSAAQAIIAPLSVQYSRRGAW